MKRTLILIRHGKAEPSRDGLADEARQLSSAGRAALATLGRVADPDLAA